MNWGDLSSILYRGQSADPFYCRIRRTPLIWSVVRNCVHADATTDTPTEGPIVTGRARLGQGGRPNVTRCLPHGTGPIRQRRSQKFVRGVLRFLVLPLFTPPSLPPSLPSLPFVPLPFSSLLNGGSGYHLRKFFETT
jgi:hypothetical protein